MTRMRCVVLAEPYRLEMRDASVPAPGPGEALVRVRRIGVCGTDLHAFRGRQPYFTYPRVLGHEIAAEIVEVSASPDGLRPGDLCVVIPYLWCGDCVACRQGRTNCCTTLKVLGVHVDGGLQEFIVVPHQNLIRADELTLEQMALVENQSIGAHAVRRAQLRAGEHVLVIGAGPIGLGVAQFAKLTETRVIVADVSETRLDFVRQWLKPDQSLNASTDLAHQLRELTAGDYPTAVFDCTGNSQSMAQAFQYVAHAGRLILVGLVQADITFHDPDFHKREMTVLSSRNATREDFENVMRSIMAGQIVIDPLTTHRVSLDRVAGAFQDWVKPESGVLKAIVEM